MDDGGSLTHLPTHLKGGGKGKGKAAAGGSGKGGSGRGGDVRTHALGDPHPPPLRQTDTRPTTGCFPACRAAGEPGAADIRHGHPGGRGGLGCKGARTLSFHPTDVLTVILWSQQPCGV